MSISLKKEVSDRLGVLFNSENPHKLESPEMRLARLRAHYAACTQCPLGTMGRSKVVFGEGVPNARLMLIGEGPGRDEDIQGRPFVGRSGKLLTKMLAELGLTREKNIFIANTVRCRPPENRQPTLDESRTCTSLILLREISIVRPTIVCTLGATATNALLDASHGISALRGRLIETPFFTLMPTYHPAYLLRSPSAAGVVKEDFLKLLHFLDNGTRELQ